jgi:pimeloyl-ACP methyl ester carboxylesterase
MQLYHKEYGRGAPLVVLHGLFGQSDNWHGMATRLAERFHLVVPDLRNHGRSPHSAEMDYPVMAWDVAELLAALGLTAAAVLGHSMGGKVAMQLALTHPRLVENLIVADMAPRAYAPLHLETLSALLALDVGSFTARQEIEGALAGPIPSLNLRRFLLKNLKRGSDGVFEWQINLHALWDHYPQLLAAVSAPQPFMGPARFIRGGQSEYIQAADEPLIRELFPRAEIRTIAGAGHWVQAAAPEEFAGLVLEFLG